MLKDLEKMTATELLNSPRLGDDFALWLVLANSRATPARRLVEKALLGLGYTSTFTITWSAAGKAWFLTTNHVKILDDSSDTEERMRFVLQHIEEKKR